MQDERPHMIRHRLRSLAEGKWVESRMGRELIELGIGEGVLAIIQARAQEILAAASAEPQSSLMKE